MDNLIWQVLLFPEGTDLTSRTKVRSDEFARKNDWPLYDYCLHPRTTGFTHLTELMRRSKYYHIQYVVNTAIYPYSDYMYIHVQVDKLSHSITPDRQHCLINEHQLKQKIHLLVSKQM